VEQLTPSVPDLFLANPIILCKKKSSEMSKAQENFLFFPSQQTRCKNESGMQCCYHKI